VLGFGTSATEGRTLIAGTLAAGAANFILSCQARPLRTTAFLLGLILSSVQVDLAMGGRIALSCAAFVADRLASLVPYLSLEMALMTCRL